MIWILVGGLSGVLLGALYFGGLWLTVRRVERAGRPALWLAASYLGRLALATAAFGLLVVRGGLPAVTSALVAFLAVRYVLIRHLGAADDPTGRPRLPRSRSPGPARGAGGEA